MSLKQDLIDARARIATPSSFARRTMARFADGKPAAPSSKNAVCWCAYGSPDGLDRAAPDRAMRVGNMQRAIRASGLKLFNRDIVTINDDPQLSHEAAHGMVVLAYDDAIATAE